MYQSYYDELYMRYNNLSQDEVLVKIEEDFGPEALYKLKTYGYLTVNDAIDCRNKLLNEAIGVFVPKTQIGSVIGWVIDVSGQKQNNSIGDIIFDWQ